MVEVAHPLLAVEVERLLTLVLEEARLLSRAVLLAPDLLLLEEPVQHSEAELLQVAVEAEWADRKALSAGNSGGNTTKNHSCS
jgi:hypothetical protein